MAISATHYHLLKKLRDDGVLPQGGRILEIGQANWYGDMQYTEMLRDLGELPFDNLEPSSLDRPLDGNWQEYSFAIVRKLYDFLMKPVSVESIDMDPAADKALRLDLNSLSLKCNERDGHDLCINHGTAEHIFNIANVFRVMHDATKVSGLMIHEAPFTGWVDHGFYNLNPTLFWDVAKVNGYDVVLMATEHLASKTAQIYESREQILEVARRGQLADNLMLFVVLRKTEDATFKVPTQAIYSEDVSPAVAKAWRELR